MARSLFLLMIVLMLGLSVAPLAGDTHQATDLAVATIWNPVTEKGLLRRPRELWLETSDYRVRGP